MQCHSNIHLDFDAFLRSIKQNIDSPFGVLLGAGASISSGVQSANDCIWDWKASIYNTQSGIHQRLADPKKSNRSRIIIQKWLDSQQSYPKFGSDEEYSFYAETAYPIEGDRRKYFENICRDKTPYVGYKLLCLLNKYGIVRSIWSTNFDGLVERAAQQANITPITITPDSVNRIYRTESSNELLYIALHGDYKYSTLKNTTTELDSQHEDFVATMRRYFIDKNLIVIGYSGRDVSLMDALTQSFTDKGAGRLYWCGLGNKIDHKVEELIQKVRAAGREAYYIDTDGFDSVMLSLMTYCFNEDIVRQSEVNEILKVISATPSVIPFNIKETETIKYIKSNLIPVTFPKEIFQFQVSIDRGIDRWKFVREKISNKGIVAAPFKDKIYAISTVSIINEVFGQNLISEIERIPITIDEIEQNLLFKELFLDAILLGIAELRGFGVDFRQKKLWLKNALTEEYDIIAHEAVECGVVFIPRQAYALLSITPSIYLESSKIITTEKKQEYSRYYLDKMWNKRYEEKLQSWCNMLSRGSDRIVFELPMNSKSGFEFHLSSKRGFIEIHRMPNDNVRAYAPRKYNPKQTIFHGIQIEEPKLEFRNAYADRPFYDVNPMRGLINHKPFDSDYYDKLPQDICLGVVCPKSFGSTFHTFIEKLNSTKYTSQSSDYIHNYIGFNRIYNCRLEIPEVNSRHWLTIADSYDSAIQLANTICASVKNLSECNPGIVVTIFIPNYWKNFKQFNHNGESFDLHNYIKAFAAHNRITTQIIEEKTLADTMMECEILWWLSLAIFVKALRTPWTLADLDHNTAYAGIGYSLKKRLGGSTDVVLGCSHIYNSQGQGLRYKLSKVEHPEFDRKNNPYLNFDEAFKFGMGILDLFQQAMEKLPNRVVIHKRTPFKKDEIDGITSALQQAGIHEIDLISITYDYHSRFIAQKVYSGELTTDNFPIDRGTCIKLSGRNALLWTHGVVPSIQHNRRYYPGGRSIPAPLKITKYYGSGDLETIAKEILGFTKMNWNSFNLYTKLPATIDTSNTLAQVGNLLRQYSGTTYDYRFFI